MDFETDQIAKVLEVERAWVAAHHSLDLEVLSRILSDEYRQIQSDGNVIGKDELLDYARFLAVYQREASEWKLVSDVSIPIAE
jgi:ketosteroid isomerase-like protein